MCSQELTNKLVSSIKYSLFVSLLICDAKFGLKLNVSKVQNCLGLLDIVHAMSDCWN